MTDDDLDEWRRQIAAAYADPVGYEAWGVNEVARLVGYADKLRADLARVTEERDATAADRTLANLLDMTVAELERARRERDEAREERDRLAARVSMARLALSAPGPAVMRAELNEALGGYASQADAILARIREEARAKARAKAREEAAQELERRASVEGDKKWAAAYRKAATRVRALNDGKDG